MEELKKLMSEEEYKDFVKSNTIDYYGDFEKGILHLRDYSGVQKFKSIRRAIRRGLVSVYGDVYPKRPFNNTSTKLKKEKQRIYEQLKRRRIA